MSLESIRDSIVSSLEGISGLKVHDHVPDAMHEFPAVAVRLYGANYTDSTFTFHLLLVARSWDEGGAALALHPFLEASGPSSIKAALDADPGNVTLEVSTVARRRINGVPYMTAQITVRALDVP
ncbi:MAG: hypothetical protein FJ313_00790 [Gemmatimonadetes bacterium]|nr:hypothetical protein [Gemmatimonadota bacterium]